MGKKKFVIIALYQKNEAFVIYIASIGQDSDVYFSRRA